jgi:hypothetical protein
MWWLLTKAIAPSNTKDQIPIQFHNIARLSVQQQTEWKQACQEELEVLKK